MQNAVPPQPSVSKNTVRCFPAEPTQPNPETRRVSGAADVSDRPRDVPLPSPGPDVHAGDPGSPRVRCDCAQTRAQQASTTTVCHVPALTLVANAASQPSRLQLCALASSPNPATRVGRGSDAASSSSDSRLSSCRTNPTLARPSWPCRLAPHVHSPPRSSTHATCPSPTETPVILTLVAESVAHGSTGLRARCVELVSSTGPRLLPRRGADLEANRTTRGACRTVRVAVGASVNRLSAMDAVRAVGASSSSDWPPSPSMPCPTSTPHVQSRPRASTLHAISAPIASVASGLWHLRWIALHDSAPRGGAVGSAAAGSTRNGSDARTADSDANSARLRAPAPHAGLAATSTAARSTGDRRPRAARG